MSVQDQGLQLGVPVWSNGQVQFTLTGEAGVSYLIESSPDLRIWTPLLTNSDPTITRELAADAPGRQSFYRASRGPLPLFAFAVAAKQTIEFKGNNIAIDSFDSADPNYSTGGLYDLAKRKDNGDVATDATMINSLLVGNARIMGHIRTGPGAGIIALAPNGSVGSTASLQGGNTGIDPGYARDDVNISWPDVQPPFSSGYTTPGGGQYPSQTRPTYDYILGSDNYRLSSFGGNVLVTGQAILLVDSSFTFNATNQITINSNASLKVYVAASSATIYYTYGNGVVNQSGDALAFQHNGLPSNTALDIASPGPALVGTIYAPEAHIGLAYTGVNTPDLSVSGAGVFNSISVNSHVRFHFDENLMRNGPFR